MWGTGTGGGRYHTVTPFTRTSSAGWCDGREKDQHAQPRAKHEYDDLEDEQRHQAAITQRSLPCLRPLVVRFQSKQEIGNQARQVHDKV